MRPTPPVGVLVMAHGTPAEPEALEAFYTSIRGGRPPSDEQLADLRRRYDAIGGTSPLAARTADQVRALDAALDADEPGGYLVRFGAKHTAPSIEAAAGELARSGVERVVGLVLTPHRSTMGSGEYLDRAAQALSAAGGPPLARIDQWYDTPGFAELLAERVNRTLAALPEPALAHPVVLFSAHSLPERVRLAGDPYPDQVGASAALVAEVTGLEGWRVAWQSAARTPEPWLGPDLLDVVRSLPAEGATAAVVCPIGFVADHLEVLYDLDVEARRVAGEVGLVFARTESLNDDPRFAEVLARAVRTAVCPRWGH